jgi:ribonuclease HII
VSIAAASIVAKVTRDRLMRAAGAAYPLYGFQNHMGYSTPEHLAALTEHGPCALHRRSFAPVRIALGLEATEETEMLPGFAA